MYLMKRIYFFLALLISTAAEAQIQPPGYVPVHQNTAYEGLSGYKFFAPPQDTFTIPTDKRNLRWAAMKGDSSYMWSVALQKWILGTGGSGSSSGAFTIYAVWPLYALNDSVIAVAIASRNDTGVITPAFYDSVLAAKRRIYTTSGDGVDTIHSVDGYGNDSVVTLIDVGANKWIEAPQVVYTGTPYTYFITGGTMRLGSQRIVIEPTTVVLDSSESDPRKDVFYSDSSGHSSVLKGTADPNPVKPQVDESWQKEITFLDIPGGVGQTPEIDTTFIYKNNEAGNWTVTFVNTTGDVNNTTNVYEGTKSINVTGQIQGSYRQFTHSGSFDLSDYDAIAGFIKLKQVIPSTANLRILWFNGGTQIGQMVTIPLVKNNTTSYQAFSLQKSLFGLNSNIVTNFRIQYVNTNATVNAGDYEDYIYLQRGISNPTSDPLVAGIDIIINGQTINADTTTGLTKLATQGDITRAISGIPVNNGLLKSGDTVQIGGYLTKPVTKILGQVSGGSTEFTFDSLSWFNVHALATAGDYQSLFTANVAGVAMNSYNRTAADPNVADSGAVVYVVQNIASLSAFNNSTFATTGILARPDSISLMGFGGGTHFTGTEVYGLGVDGYGRIVETGITGSSLADSIAAHTINQRFGKSGEDTRSTASRSFSLRGLDQFIIDSASNVFITTARSHGGKGRFTLEDTTATMFADDGTGPNVVTMFVQPHGAFLQLPGFGSHANGTPLILIDNTTGQIGYGNAVAGSVTSVARTNGFGISASVANSTTTPDITIGIDSASSALKSYIAQYGVTGARKTINNLDSVVGTGNIRTTVEGYNTIADASPNGYEGFPYVDVLGDHILYIWKSSTTHAGSGALMLARSRDGNRTIDSTWQLNVGGAITGSNFSFGVIKSGVHAGRVCIGWRDAAVSTTVEFSAYSDDEMRTWTAGNTITHASAGTSFGRIKQIGGDTILRHWYSSGTPDSAFLYYSTDGATWAFFANLAVSATQDYNESDLQYLGNNRVIAVTRSESPLNRPSQFTSTNNGHTWTRVGGLNLLNFSTNNTPTFIEKYDNQLWLFSNYRAGDGNHSVWWYSHATEALAFSDTSKWAKRSAYYHPLNDDADNATLGINTGYTVPFQLAGRIMVSGYDNSPLQTTSGTAKVRAFTVPIIANGDFAKVYNDANQSISNNTATLVTYSQVDLNDDLTFDTDSGFVIVKRDGWYTYKTAATYDVSAAGTYRQLYVKVTSALYVAVASLQPQIISQTTIPGNATNSDFNRMECDGVYYFRKGEQIRIYTKQDSGGSLNLVNTTPNSMATLIIKRLSE